MPEALPVMAEDALLSADNSSSSRFSRLRTLPSAASTVRSMSSLSSVTSETLALLCSAAAICIYTWATVRPFSAAAFRSMVTCSAGAEASSPSLTSPTPSTCSSRRAMVRALLCRSVISLPNTCSDTPLPVI